MRRLACEHRTRPHSRGICVHVRPRGQSKAFPDQRFHPWVQPAHILKRRSKTHADPSQEGYVCYVYRTKEKQPDITTRYESYHNPSCTRVCGTRVCFTCVVYGSAPGKHAHPALPAWSLPQHGPLPPWLPPIVSHRCINSIRQTFPIFYGICMEEHTCQGDYFK